MVLEAGWAADVNAASNHKVARVLAHLADPLFARQGAAAQGLAGNLLVGAPSECWKLARCPRIYRPLPKILALRAKLLLPGVLVDGNTISFPKREQRTLGSHGVLSDRVVVEELLLRGVSVHPKLLARRSLNGTVRRVEPPLLRSKRKRCNGDVQVVLATLKLLWKLRDGALLRCDDRTDHFAHP